MFYAPRAKLVEASHVKLAGIDYMAVSLEGRAHTVPRDIFELFFAQVPYKPPAPPKVSLASIPNGNRNHR